MMPRSLAFTHRKLVRQWHPTRNGELAPADVTASSKRRVWWRCSRGPDHEWIAAIDRRTYKGTGCPFCAGRRVSVTNSLALLRPDLADQWHPTKNGHLVPEGVVVGSQKRVWWRCPKGPDHEWSSLVFVRAVKGAGCPFCSGQRASVTNSLASLFPDVADQWHPEKNGALRPRDLPAGSEQRVWWKCPAGPDHEWQTKVSDRTLGGHGCPFCVNHRISVTNSLASLFPDLAAQWHMTKNGTIKPEDVVAGSNQYAWWSCSEGPDHEWRSQIISRTLLRTGCPFCAGRKASVTNSLATLYPRLAAQWHPTKNGTLTPHDVTHGSGKLVWWKCPAGPDHEWQKKITRRTRRSQDRCPFCINRRVSATNCLETLFPKVAWEWDPDRNGELTPKDVVAASKKSYWWRCALGHVWQAPVNQRTVRRRGCPVCARGGFR